jgi:hypothetical protein
MLKPRRETEENLIILDRNFLNLNVWGPLLFGYHEVIVVGCHGYATHFYDFMVIILRTSSYIHQRPV